MYYFIAFFLTICAYMFV
jgi:pimeloyl-ACP methyl ester carboxylesterase